MTVEEKNQGEGNREAARRYNEAGHEFVKSGQVDEKTGAETLTEEEQRELEEAEKAGKARAKEKDPAVTRDYTKSDK